MPKLSLSDEFLKDCYELDKRVQRDVFAAIEKFRDGNPGQHLEKLEGAKDPKIRTIRVNSNHRGVVLAPDGGEDHVLLAVMPHDKANKFATSKRFTVNGALGVLESRDQAALDSAEPELAQHLSSERGLFDQFKDAELEQLGIDADVLTVVRPMTSLEQLDALEKLLPAAQHSVLAGLAAGYGKHDMWRQISAELFADEAPATVDSEDIGAAVARTPGRFVPVSGPDELREMLDAPFERWRIFLHPKQRAVAYRKSYRGPALISGGPGTGKTVTVVHRAAHLAENASGSVLLTTFNRVLADSLEQQLDQLIGNSEARARIRVTNVDRMANEIVSAARGEALSLVHDAELESWFDRAAQNHGGEFTGMFLKREWEQVILAQQLRTERAYLAALRHGRGRRISTRQREVAWAAISEVLGMLRNYGKWTHPQIADEAARISAENSAAHQHVLVDEGQDLHPAQWRLLRHCVESGPDDLFIASDPNQRIYESRVSLGSLGIEVRGRSHRLTVSYRTTQETLLWASAVLAGTVADGLDGQPDPLDGYRSSVRGRKPTVRAFDTWEDELAGLVQQVQQWLDDGVEPSAIGVASRKRVRAKEVREALGDAGIECTERRSVEGVRVATMHATKGEEFRCMALVGVDAENVPPPRAITSPEEDQTAHEQDLQRERCVLFVASTRCRDLLYVSYSGAPSRFLRN